MGLEDAPNVEACNEWFLFHGSNPRNCGSIASGGFTLSLAGTGSTWKDEGTKKGAPLYGDGIYFAESVTKADEYSEMVEAGKPYAGCHTLLVCRVLCGRVQWCDSDKIDPSLLQKQVYDATQVYPEYVVYYRRLYGDR